MKIGISHCTGAGWYGQLIGPSSQPYNVFPQVILMILNELVIASLIAFVCRVIPATTMIKTAIDRELTPYVDGQKRDQDNAHSECNHCSFRS